MTSRIPKVDKVDADGQTYLRDGITAAFFLPVPLADVAQPVRSVAERYLSTSFKKSLRWASVGADSEEWRPISAKTFDRCLAMLSPEATRKRKLTAFEIFDGKRDGDAPGCGILVLGNPKDRREPRETNLLQMYFPSEVLESAAKADTFVKWISESAAVLPYLYAYASPGLHWAESHQIEALTAARGIAKRYAGLDIQNNESCRSDIDTMTRGARWLTYLGPQLVQKLGGPKQIQAIHCGDISVTQVGQGLMIRAGALPEIGDRNRKDDTPLLKAVARLLKPVTLFDEPALKETVIALDDPSFLPEWEQRFLR